MTPEARAAALPHMGGAVIGPMLRELARGVPEGRAIVEVGCWLGAATAWLLMGAEDDVAVHCFDRFFCPPRDVAKAAGFGLRVTPWADTRPLVAGLLAPFGANVALHKTRIRDIPAWSGPPIGLYVDDASKRGHDWMHVMRVFRPHFVPQQTRLVLMDYHWAGVCQPAWMASERAHFVHESDLPEPVPGAVFRYLG